MKAVAALFLSLAVVTGGGEQQSGDDIRTATIQLSTGSRFVQYTAIDGLAIFEGDIVLGTVEEFEHHRFSPAANAVAINGSQYRWPDGTIPYTIASSLPDWARVIDAIAHWEDKTNFRFVPRTNQRDYVTFRPGNGCSSSVGRRGGEQFVTLAEGCAKGSAIHEIAHVIGLWHEHGREDRDRFVTINWANIRAESVHNFNQHVGDGQDTGPYDYASIMHYPRNAFSIDGSDTIIAVDPKARIGQRDALSAGDIAAANSLCLRPPVSDLAQSGGTTASGKRRSVGGG
jgi:Astacin (Peptidase family M12A)